MKSKTSFLFLLVLFLLSSTLGCGRNQFRTEQGYTDVLLTLVIPDYDSYPKTRIIDPATYKVLVLVSGPGLSDLEYEFYLQQDGGEFNNTGRYFECMIPGIPVGKARRFMVTTYDREGKELAAGTETVNLSLNKLNKIGIALCPVEYVVLSISQKQVITNSVGNGKMKYYQIDPEDYELVEVKVRGDSEEIKVFYLYQNGVLEGLIPLNEKEGADEGSIILSQSDSHRYIGVYGRSSPDFTLSSFTISLHEVVI